MGKADRELTTLDDDEGNRFYAIWSRSGKRLIVTIMDSAPPYGGLMRQVELRPDQVESLITSLSESVERKTELPLAEHPAGHGKRA